MVGGYGQKTAVKSPELAPLTASPGVQSLQLSPPLREAGGGMEGYLGLFVQETCVSVSGDGKGLEV